MTIEPLPTNTIAGAFLLGFPALFSIVNPIGSALVFYNLTELNTHAERIALARRVAVYALLVLLGSILLGGYLLNFFGVSLGALRVAGGLVVIASAWPLLMGPAPSPPPEAQRHQASPAELSARAFFPITMPITTGPGSISVAIALASDRPETGAGVLQFFAGLSLASLANVVLVYLCYAGADRVMRLVGAGGASIVSRLAAFLLLCIGVQILATGAEALLSPWVIHTARQVG
jgi:multiple antibiotic resistance protein